MRYDPRRLWWLLAAGGMFLVPWVVVLGVTLPATTTAWHWATAWVGLDSMEAVGLLATGLLLYRRDGRACLTATATAVLLVVDAWFDVNTSAAGWDKLIALVMAGAAELPLGAVCLLVAGWVYRRVTAATGSKTPTLSSWQS